MRRAAGFTLIEMMIAVALLAIIAAMAAPSFTDLIRNGRLATTSNELLAALHLARAEAIKQRRTIRVCPSNGAGDPDDLDCAEDEDWSGGWLIRGPNGVIRVWEPLQAGLELEGPEDGLSFLADGRVMAAGAFSVGQAGSSRMVNVSATGRAAVDGY